MTRRNNASAKSRRTERVTLYLTPEEMQSFRKLAEDRRSTLAECGRSMIAGEPFFVRICLQADPEPVRYLAEMMDRSVRMTEELVMRADQSEEEKADARQALAEMMDTQHRIFRMLEQWKEETIAVFKTDIASWPGLQERFGIFKMQIS